MKPGDKGILWGQYIATVLEIRGQKALVLYFHGSEGRPQKIWVDVTALFQEEAQRMRALEEEERDRQDWIEYCRDRQFWRE